MLEGTNIETTCPTRKLADKRYGPFVIVEKVGSSAYKLKLPPSWSQKHLVFNESLLTPYKSLVFNLQRTPAPPPPDIINEVPEYEVEEIQDSRLFRGKLQYLVKWKGYLNEERTWEPEKNVENSPDLVKTFY